MTSAEITKSLRKKSSEEAKISTVTVVLSRLEETPSFTAAFWKGMAQGTKKGKLDAIVRRARKEAKRTMLDRMERACDES